MYKVYFLVKLPGLRHATLLKKRLWRWCFPVNFAKFLRTHDMPYSLTVFTECDHRKSHSVKSSRIRSFSGPYSVRLRENKDQKNSEYVHFSLSARLLIQGNAFLVSYFENGNLLQEN